MNQPPPDYGPPGVPPPPPPPPPEGWQVARPTSGKAIASLICGGAGLVLGFACGIPGVAALVGVVLGIIAIIETGRNGTRSGRGLAIAGTVVSTLAIVTLVGVYATLFAFFGREMEEQESDRHERIDADVQLIVDRVQEYYEKNGGSLGPGGPVLALAPMQSETVVQRKSGEHTEADEIPNTRDGKVVGALTIRHLVRQGELRYSPRLDRWELTVTDRAKATIRATGWGGEVVREVNITDAGRGTYVQSYGSTTR